MTKSGKGKRRKFFLQAAGLRPDLSIVPGQPFRLGLIRHLLLLMHDPDTGLIDIAESGFHTAVFEPIQYSGFWRQQSDALEDLHFEVCDTSWKSAEEDPDTVTRLLQEDIDAKFVQEFHAEISQQRSVGLKELQLAASAFQGPKAEPLASVKTAR